MCKQGAGRAWGRGRFVIRICHPLEWGRRAKAIVVFRAGFVFGRIGTIKAHRLIFVSFCPEEAKPCCLPRRRAHETFLSRRFSCWVFGESLRILSRTSTRRSFR